MQPRKTKPSSKPRGARRATSTHGLLQRISPEEAASILHHLLDRHPELQVEAEQFATQLVCECSIEDIADDVGSRILSIDIDDLNERAGRHSWGYVEPTQAAYDLMEEALSDLLDDMKRKAESGLISTGETICVGMIDGLYRIRNADSDGALGWDPDFPCEHAGWTLEEFLRACPAKLRKAAQKNVMEMLVQRAPEWAEVFRHSAADALKK